ncbi:MAG: acyl-CoA acyltransferase [Thiovulaceae bacterium]|nr:acyl-CoA acyltransferase [Sulfurimonadaceae bacterium]
MSIGISKASKEDAGFLAQMILQSSRAEKKIGIYDLVFGVKNDDDLLSYLEKLVVTETKNHCHFSNFLIANIDGKQVGTLCSYEPRISTHEAFIKSLEEINYTGDISEYEDILTLCDFEQNNRTLIFDFMEELEGFINVGVLKALMQKSLLTARLKGYRIAQTIVEIGSLETILLYKKLGFKEVKQKECELYKEKFGRVGLTLLEIEF